MKTSKEMLEEKGIDEVYSVCTIETLAMLFRSNSHSGPLYPAEYKVPKLNNASLEESEKAFAEEAEMLLTDREMALASIAVGIDIFTSLFFKEMHKGGMATMSDKERVQLLTDYDDDYLFGLILSSVCTAMAALERRVKEGQPLFEKLDWSYKSVQARANEIAMLCNKDFDELIEKTPQVDPMQIRVTALVDSISRIMAFTGIFEVARELDTTPITVYEAAGQENINALSEVIFGIGTELLRQKVIMDFGLDFYNEVSELCDKEKLQEEKE